MCSRRILFCAIALLLAGLPTRLESQQVLTVAETAGIRRFQYPVAVALPENIPHDAKLRLILGEKPHPAQFRRVEVEGKPATWWLDFNVDLLPYTRSDFTVQYGPEVESAGEPEAGLKLAETADAFQVINAPYITWEIRRRPLDWLRSVEVPEFEHVRREGSRFVLHGEGDAQHVLGSSEGETVEARVMRSGPLAMALQYNVHNSDGPFARTRSRITLTFPFAKSWVEIDWQLEDPDNRVIARDVEIAQNLDVPTNRDPVFVDFGATTLVYLMLGAGQASELRSSARGDEPSWQVRKGAENHLEPFVRDVRPKPGFHEAEGWTHVMDRTRCLALAVGGFGGGDSIHVAASGAVRARWVHNSLRAGKNASFRTWLHFVGFPPHLTAATSPQSMQRPPTVIIH